MVKCLLVSLTTKTILGFLWILILSSVSLGWSLEDTTAGLFLNDNMSLIQLMQHGYKADHHTTQQLTSLMHTTQKVLSGHKADASPALRSSILTPATTDQRPGGSGKFWQTMAKEIRSHESFTSDTLSANLLFVDYDTIRQCKWPNYNLDNASVNCPNGEPLWWSPNDGIPAFVATASKHCAETRDTEKPAYVFLANVHQWANDLRDFQNLQQVWKSKDLDHRCGKLFIAGLDLVRSNINLERVVNLLQPLTIRMQKELGEVTPICQARRKYLASFKGKSWVRSVPGHPVPTARDQMFKTIHNAEDVILIDSEHPFISIDYVDLLKNSTFGFVVPGDAHYSFRLTEVLKAGSIPVIIDDELTPPYGLPDFAGWAVQIPEASMIGAADVLRKFSDEEICAMQRSGQELVKDGDMRSVVGKMLHAFKPKLINTYLSSNSNSSGNINSSSIFKRSLDTSNTHSSSNSSTSNSGNTNSSTTSNNNQNATALAKGSSLAAPVGDRVT